MVLTHDTNNDGAFTPGAGDNFVTTTGDTNGEGLITYNVKFVPDGDFQAEVELTDSTLTHNRSLDADNMKYAKIENRK